ncbi:MAG: hypothetical protein U0L73_02125, partial [Ruminococcus bromii]|nr:hypothetical protein [Ruminococcus bromii]
FTDKNGVLGNFDFSIDGFSVSKSGNSMTVYTKSVNTTATLGSFKSTSHDLPFDMNTVMAILLT